MATAMTNCNFGNRFFGEPMCHSGGKTEYPNPSPVAYFGFFQSTPGSLLKVPAACLVQSMHNAALGFAAGGESGCRHLETSAPKSRRHNVHEKMFSCGADCASASSKHGRHSTEPWWPSTIELWPSQSVPQKSQAITMPSSSLRCMGPSYALFAVIAEPAYTILTRHPWP